MMLGYVGNMDGGLNIATASESSVCHSSHSDFRRGRFLGNGFTASRFARGASLSLMSVRMNSIVLRFIIF